jgi:hypothetical protein
MNIKSKSNKAHCSTTNEASHEQIVKIISTRVNQKQILLKHLKKYGRINTQEAIEKYHIFSPSKRISELNEKQHNIISVPDWNKNGMVTYVLNPDIGAIFNTEANNG